MARYLYRIVIPASRIASYVSEAILAILMFLVFADVIMRYFFNSPIPGSYELTEMFTGLVVALSLAYCAVNKGHIYVELVVSWFSQRGQAVLGIIGGILSIGIVFIMTWQAFVYVTVTFNSGQSTPTLLIPFLPFAVLTAIGFSLFLLVLIADFLDILSRRVKP